jgi:LSD1 subclass zinc finger protein
MPLPYGPLAGRSWTSIVDLCLRSSSAALHCPVQSPSSLMWYQRQVSPRCGYHCAWIAVEMDLLSLRFVAWQTKLPARFRRTAATAPPSLSRLTTVLTGGQHPPPHSHLMCSGCSTLLMYAQGASAVRCSRCQTVTPAPPSGPGATESSQLVCNGCRVLLSYPRGAQSVQCSVCHTVTQVSRGLHSTVPLSKKEHTGFSTCALGVTIA